MSSSSKMLRFNFQPYWWSKIASQIFRINWPIHSNLYAVLFSHIYPQHHIITEMFFKKKNLSRANLIELLVFWLDDKKKLITNKYFKLLTRRNKGNKRLNVFLRFLSKWTDAFFQIRNHPFHFNRIIAFTVCIRISSVNNM